MGYARDWGPTNSPLPVTGRVVWGAPCWAVWEFEGVGWCILVRVQANLAASGKNTMPQADTDVKVEPLLGDSKRRPGRRMELLQFWRIYRSAKFLVSRLCVPHMGFFTFKHGKWKLYFDVFCYVDPWHARTSGPDMRNFSELFGTEMGRRAQPITERQVRVKWRVQFNNRNTMRWEMFHFRCRFKR